MRYYLHQIHTNETVLDFEGSEHPDLDAARVEAIDAAREMMADAVRVGRDISGWSFQITDAHDVIQGHVPFASAIRVDPAQPVLVTEVTV